MTTTVNEWAPLTSHAVGDLIVAHNVDGSHNIHACLVAGTTGAKPPVQWAQHGIGEAYPNTTADGVDGTHVLWNLTGLTALLNPGVGWYYVSA
jgi:hypothetical protein